jgi:hypothetical protein
MRRVALFCLIPLLSCAPSRDESPNDAKAVAEKLRVAFPIKPSSTSSLIASLPARASSALHVGLDADVWIELSPRGARDVAAREVDGISVFASALPDLDLAYVRESDRVEELRVAHSRAAASRATWDVRLGPGVSAIRVKDNHVEVLDARGVVRLQTTTAYAIDARATRRDLTMAVEGSTLTATLDAQDLAVPIAIDPAWTAISAKMPGGPRVFPFAAKLSSGKVIVAGGNSLGGTSASRVEIFDPATNTWASAPDLPGPVEDTDEIVLVQSGTKLLLTSSRTCSSTGCTSSTNSYLYDPTTGSATPAPMPVASRRHTATLLADGRVVVIGGQGDGPGAVPAPSNIRIWKTDNTWTNIPAPPCCGTPWPLNDGRWRHSAVLHSSGKVFFSGGYALSGGGGGDRAVADTLTFDPADNSLKQLDYMPAKRAQHYSFEITAGAHKGDILVFSGLIATLDEKAFITSNGSIYYNFTSNKWALGPSLSIARSYPGVAVLSGGRLLVSGGAPNLGVSFSAYDTAEYLDPVAWVFKSAGKMISPRAAHGAVALDGLSAVLVGGAAGVKEGFGEWLDTAEKFQLQALGAKCAADGECDSGFCADGVCCNTACTEQCAACDVTGKAGTCTAVTGTPHGTRSACSSDPSDCAKRCDGADTAACKFPGTTAACGKKSCVAGVETHIATCDGAGKCTDIPKACGQLACGADACKTTCASKADCVNPSDFCESGKCLPQLSNGLGCINDAACASGFCVDGVCCESKCEGQCEACDVPGQGGKCVAVKGKAHGTRTACTVDTANACNSKACDGTNTAACVGSIGPCGDYGCDAVELTCKKSCLVDADCADGRECAGGKCQPRTSKCSTDRAEVVAADLTKTPCAPYACRDGVCATECRTSNDCLGGFICDPSQKCVSAATAVGGDEGGCSYGRSSTSLFGIALMTLGLLARRRSALGQR